MVMQHMIRGELCREHSVLHSFAASSAKFTAFFRISKCCHELHQIRKT